MKRLLFILTTLLLAACQAAAPPPVATPAATAELPPELLADRGPAPELNNPLWLNVDAPVTLDALRGQVVLLTFWTFG